MEPCSFDPSGRDNRAPLPAIQAHEYELVIRQQPKHTKVHDPKKDKDRRTVDPVPIIQLQTRNASSGDSISCGNLYLCHPYVFMHATLIDTSGVNAIQDKPITSGYVSSLHRVRDIGDQDIAVFAFPDVSIKKTGEFRLLFTLYEIRSGSAVSIMSTVSDIFKVFPAKEWKASYVKEPSQFTKSLIEQGVKIKVRKPTSQTAGIKRSVQDSSDWGFASSSSSKMPKSAEPSISASYAASSPMSTLPGYVQAALAQPPFVPSTSMHTSSMHTTMAGHPVSMAGSYYQHPSEMPYAGYNQYRPPGPGYR